MEKQQIQKQLVDIKKIDFIKFINTNKDFKKDLDIRFRKDLDFFIKNVCRTKFNFLRFEQTILEDSKDDEQSYNYNIESNLFILQNLILKNF
jgi:hypothetical protein